MSQPARQPFGGGISLPTLRAREHVTARDVRTMLVLRLLGFAIATLVTVPSGLPTDVHFYALVVITGFGALLVPVTVLAKTPRLRRRAFDSGFAVDLVVLTLLFHLTGGIASPLLPLALAWATLGVLAYRRTLAVVFTSGLIATIALQPLINATSHSHPVVGGTYTSAAIILLLVIGVAVSVEIAARVLDNSHQALDELASTDPLTGLFNRRAFDLRLEQLVSFKERPPFTLALIDLDHFKLINDNYGHTIGDRVLTSFAHRLVETMRDADQIYRIGGEEFAMILPQTTPEQACAVVRRIQDKFDSQPIPDGLPAITFSAGLASGSDPCPFDTADQRLYQAKEDGRAQILC